MPMKIFFTCQVLMMVKYSLNQQFNTINVKQKYRSSYNLGGAELSLVDLELVYSDFESLTRVNPVNSNLDWI